MGELPCLGVHEAERILQPQSLLQGQQAMLKASLTGAWLNPNQVLVIGHTVPVPPKTSGVPKALLLERNGQLSCNPKKKRKKKGCRRRKACAPAFQQEHRLMQL